MSDLKQKNGRVEIGRIDLRRIARMVDILCKNGFSEQDLFNLTLLFLLDLAISDEKAFYKLVYFIKNNADYMRSKGIKSAFEGFEFK
jgi:hypothetical protein